LPGTYTVSLNVTDDDGLTDTDYCTITVLEYNPPNQPPVPIIEVDGYLGHYYNLPDDHSEVEGEITGIVPGDSPFNHDWYDEEYYSFSRLDTDLTFGNDFFPVDEGLPGDPLYFAVHWETNIDIPVTGNYSFEIGSDDDSWVYIDNQMVCDLGGIHALAISAHTTYLTTGPHKLDIYFAERRSVQSGFYFKFVDNEVETSTSARLSGYTGTIRVDMNQTIELSAAGSFDTDGEIINYTWNFGDGILAYGANVSHAYVNESERTITLAISDDDGSVSKKAIFLNVVSVPIPMVEFGIVIDSEADNDLSGVNNDEVVGSAGFNGIVGMSYAIIFVILWISMFVFIYRKIGPGNHDDK
jgi:fibro-slime domain-containing protein